MNNYNNKIIQRLKFELKQELKSISDKDEKLKLVSHKVEKMKQLIKIKPSDIYRDESAQTIGINLLSLYNESCDIEYEGVLLNIYFDIIINKLKYKNAKNRPHE